MAKVLVVDDEQDSLDLVQTLLETEGYSVVTAFDGLTALDMAEAEQPDLIILDLAMPTMSGYEVAEQLQADPLTRNIPILCLTAADSLTARARSRKAGAAALISKPFAPADLLDAVGKLLQNA
jgi:CheY-like chemotaxis protein